MRAAVCREFGAPLRVEELDLRAPQAGEVRVRVRACAVCHSDILLLRGAWGGDLPAVYGHEAAGVVEEVGAGVQALGPGDHVVVTLVRACGRCASCVRGAPSLCEDWPLLPISQRSPLATPDGEVVAQGVRTAAFAESVLVHESQVVRVPHDLDLECAALLACGVITGVGAVLNTAQVEVGASTAVIGAGGVGLNVVQGARLAGAGVVLAVDLVESKLAAATSFGATHVLDATTADVRAEVAALTHGRGLDYVFVAAASAAAVEQGLDLLRRGGTLVVVGMPPSGATAAVEAVRVADDGLRIVGSKMGSTRPNLDVPRLVELYGQGRLMLDELISDRYALEDIDDAIASAERGETLRAVVVV